MRRAADWPSTHEGWASDAAAAVVLRLACIRCEARQLLGTLRLTERSQDTLYSELVLSQSAKRAGGAARRLPETARVLEMCVQGAPD